MHYVFISLTFAQVFKSTCYAYFNRFYNHGCHHEQLHTHSETAGFGTGKNEH